MGQVPCGVNNSLTFSAPGKRDRLPEMVTSVRSLSSVCEHLPSQNLLWGNTFWGEYYISRPNEY